MWDVGVEGCSGCGMLGMWDAGMWDVGLQNVMEEHQDKLNGICQLCRKAIKLGQRYVNKKVKDSYKTKIFSIMILKMMLLLSILNAYVIIAGGSLTWSRRIVRKKYFKKEMNLSSYIATTVGFV